MKQVVYIPVSTNAAGCTHIDSLNLIISISIFLILFLYLHVIYIHGIVDGQTYTSSGIYINKDVNAVILR